MRAARTPPLPAPITHKSYMNFLLVAEDIFVSSVAALGEAEGGLLLGFSEAELAGGSLSVELR
jgi:hypothetical protein